MRDLAAVAFPQELILIPDGLGERLAENNLYRIDRRSALTGLDLGLVSGRSAPMPGEELVRRRVCDGSSGKRATTSASAARAESRSPRRMASSARR